MRASEVQHLSIVRAQRDKGVNVLQSIRPTRKSTFSEEGSGISFSLDRTSQRNTSRAKEKKKKKRMTNGSSEIELAMVTNVDGGKSQRLMLSARIGSIGLSLLSAIRRESSHLHSRRGNALDCVLASPSSLVVIGILFGIN